MKSWWVTFTDGTQVCCDGESAYDAKRIAEHFTKKKVAGGEYKDFDVKELPYPSSKAAWRYEHPIHGAIPSFCYTPNKCAGNSSCPRQPACSE